MDQFNFGEILINTENRTATFSIRDMEFYSFLERSFDLDGDMRFYEAALGRNSALCKSVQKDKQYVMFVIITLRNIVR